VDFDREGGSSLVKRTTIVGQREKRHIGFTILNALAIAAVYVKKVFSLLTIVFAEEITIFENM
jgi:hypothetical protein